MALTTVLMSRKQLVKDHEFTIDIDSLYKYTIALCNPQAQKQFLFWTVPDIPLQ